jgi:hypothetical protein
MYFINFITYRREGDQMVAYRIQRAHGYEDVRVVPFAPLFKGHAEWVGEQVDEYLKAREAIQRKQAATNRYNVAA